MIKQWAGRMSLVQMIKQWAGRPVKVQISLLIKLYFLHVLIYIYNTNNDDFIILFSYTNHESTSIPTIKSGLNKTFD